MAASARPVGRPVTDPSSVTKTSSSGWVDTSVTATTTGDWRVVYWGNSVAARVVYWGNNVDVTK